MLCSVGRIAADGCAAVSSNDEALLLGQTVELESGPIMLKMTGRRTRPDNVNSDIVDYFKENLE